MLKSLDLTCLKLGFSLIESDLYTFPGFSADVYEGLEFLQGEQLIIECHGISQYLFHICMCKHCLS